MRVAAGLLLLVSAACSKGAAQPGPRKLGEACSATAPCEASLVCTDAPVGLPATPGHAACAAPGRRYTFRAIGGASMGAVGASRLVAAHPERYDAAGFLGGPLDATLLLHTMETAQLGGGFCPPDKLLAALALDLTDGGNRLDRPGGIAGCTEENVKPATHYSRSQRFNHWAFTTNGGHFDRDAYLDIFRDLTLAIGNPLSTRAESPSLPAGISPAQFAAATCASPAVVPHAFHPLYSPHGEASAITFCDGEPPVRLCADGTLVDWCAAAKLSGRALATEGDQTAFCAQHGGDAHDADQHGLPAEADAYYAHHGEVAGCWAGTRKVSFALALDLNGNGRRDYHEPVLALAREPFSDVGADGCPNEREDGKGGCTDAASSPHARGVADPNGDDYDALKNPAGTEGNWRWDPGEPFEDVGLDGVAGTHDEGEGDGKYTQSLGVQRWLDGDLRLHLPRSVDLYIEGGIRDVFDLGAQAEATGGAVPGVRAWADFFSLPPLHGVPWGASFDPLRVDIAALGRNVLLNYGTPTPTPEAARLGDGDHVGTAEQAYDRFLVFFRWLSARWDPVLPPPAATHVSGTTEQLHFRSAALGAEQDFAVSVPPSYATSPQRRYPVLLLLHGYGQSVADFSGTSFILDALSNAGLVRDLIVVYPSGRCCLTGPRGERTCRDADDSGVSYESQGYVRECARGSFYQNRLGLTGADNTRYADAIDELAALVDQRYRTLAPADGPAF